MQISLNWINDYVKIKDKNPKEIADLVTKSGINIEKITRQSLDHLTVGKVISKVPHPDSDHLNVCMVDLGDEKVQIVCGAPNVEENQKVIVSKIGAILPGDFEIKKSVIRGVESNGMICSLGELGLEDKEANYHKGIHVLSDDAIVGSNPFTYLGLDDVIYDLDLNPNRNDCLSHLGFAYQVAAVLDEPILLPEIKVTPIEKSAKDYLGVKVETQNCPLYLARIVENVQVGPSPEWLKDRLSAVGMRSINNVVDISNYIMLEYGQPLHFFDKEKLGDTIGVRMAKDGEEIVTLDEKTRKLTSEDIIITDGENPVAIAGVMGGLSTEVTSDTKAIIIESAVFSPLNVRYTSIRLDLRSEASLRMEKGLNKEYTMDAINRACYLLEKYASAKVFSDVVEYDALEQKEKRVEITLEKINQVLGLTLTKEEVLDCFRRLKFKVELKDDAFHVVIPNRRMDVNILQDLIEEVGSIYGYDEIKAKMPKLEIVRGGYNENAKYRKDISKFMRSLGYQETRTYTLISEDEGKMFNYHNGEDIHLLKPMSSEKSTLRQSILPSLYKVYQYNVDHQQDEVMIYEISNVYGLENSEYKETMKLGGLLSGNYLSSPWQKKNTLEIDFYLVKGMIESLLKYLGLSNRYEMVKGNLPKEMHPFVCCEILVDHEAVGYLGQLHPKYSKEKVFVFELNLTLLKTKRTKAIHYKEPNRYPKVVKDMAFIVDKNVEAETIRKQMKKSGGKLVSHIEAFDCYEGENLEKGKKSLAFSITFENDTKTLTEDEVMEVFHKMTLDVSKECQAKLRDQ